MASQSSRWQRLERGLVVAAAIACLSVLLKAGLPIGFQAELRGLWLMLQQQFTIPAASLEALLLPSFVGVAGLLCFKVIQPKATPPSRVIFTSIAVLLTLRYWLWRCSHTLNLDSPLDASLSLILLFAEGICFLGGTGGAFFAMFRVERSQEADQLSKPVMAGAYQPSVDVIIPTYNEPPEILRRTVVGCQAIDYDNKKVYLLDDQRRPEIRALARELGCGYRDRPNNDHAKAGNINHALLSLQGELLAVFDADYVPSSNFLTRTVGFFRVAKVALLQTPQNFFNEDPITANLGLQGIVNNEQNFFFRHLQPSRDAFNAVVCCGSCFVVRRSALDEIGGIPTDSIAEDMFTSIRLQALGYEIKYLNEPLSAGMSAEDTSAYSNQRLRWGRGTLQLMFCRPNPLTTRGLNLGQRLYHALSILYWVNAVPRLIFLLLPPLCLLLELTPVNAEVEQILFFFLPLYLYNLLSFSWLMGGWRSIFWSDVYDIMLCVPMSIMTFQALTNPFGQGFKVTPKGLDSGEKIRPNWGLIKPLFGILVLTLFALMEYAINRPWKTMGQETLWINGAWSLYNIALITMAILASIDVPQRRYPRFEQALNCHLQIGDWIATGQTLDLSEAGAQIRLALPARGFPESGEGCHFLIPAQIPSDLVTQPCWPELRIPAEIAWGKREVLNDGLGDRPETVRVGLQFQSVPLEPYRALIEGLFCQPGQWPDVHVPEYRTVWAFLTSLWRLYPLTGSRG